MFDGVFVFPVSFAQQRLWFLDQFEPGSALYNVPEVFDFRGPLTGEASPGSLNGVVRRHEALRTTFPASTGNPCRCPLRAGRAAAEADLRHRRSPCAPPRGPGLQAKSSAAVRSRSAARSFARCCCGCRTSRAHLVVTMHHIVSDGWSLGRARAELRALYEAFVRGSRAPCRRCPSSTPTSRCGSGSGCRATCSTRSWPTGGSSSPARRRARPADGPAAPAPSRGSAAPASVRLPEALSASLKRAGQARRRDAVHDACWRPSRSLLHRYTGQDDIVVGAPIASRNRAELEAADRVLRQHAGAPDRSGGRPELRRAAGARAGGGLGPTRTRTCRSRSWWRRCSPRAPQLAADLPGEPVVPARPCPCPPAGVELRSACGAPGRRGAKFDLSCTSSTPAAGQAGSSTTPTSSTSHHGADVANFPALLADIVADPARRPSRLASSARASGGASCSRGTPPSGLARTRARHEFSSDRPRGRRADRCRLRGGRPPLRRR